MLDFSENNLVLEKRGAKELTVRFPSPRHPVILSANDWDVESTQQSIEVPLLFSGGDWIPRDQQILGVVCLFWLVMKSAYTLVNQHSNGK